MNIPEIIVRKREGHPTTPQEMEALLRGLLSGDIPEYQISAWLMAVLFRGMEADETAALTRIMMESGEVLDLSDRPGVQVDKHSTGGVGDKISIPLAPLVASAGVSVPMISGRGLGHTGGTLDKLESIPGLRTDLSPAEFRSVLGKTGFCIASAGENLAPADARLYALRDVTGTVPSIPLITASILSKKYAAGVGALVLDVKTGSGAFMRDLEDARELARVLVAVSERMGKRAVALVTSMDQPLGCAVGNALEIAESVEVLTGGGPEDVVELTLALGAEMLAVAGVEEDRAVGRDLLAERIASGAAMERFEDWVAAQGGDPAAVTDPGKLPRAPVCVAATAPEAGVLAAIDTAEVGLAANGLGAGRAKVGDAVDPAVGIVFHARLGDVLEEGDPFAEVHARTADDAAAATARLLRAVRLCEEPMEARPLVIDRGAPGVA
ncbi:MAG: thymidine phosphorylase [Gemmatimonadota bacterium]|jgi:pyrimidine-nucleoside phosphorylase|nr:thymidine phosphorylase [Gemmatimonadota bacterium]MDP6803468.1 thymidine phosphorylase [Gemmatimonadota bacterium]MDP7032590.1 thymidine phosphorylase [Gemmatimonadota bacterium]